MSKENIGSRIELADGHTMPQEGLGVYRMTDEAELIQSVKSAYDDGYRLFDTAQMYGNEAAVGQAIKELNVARDDIFVTTKVAEENQGYDQTIASVEESLKKLQLDYVDLLLVHWPIHTHFLKLGEHSKLSRNRAWLNQLERVTMACCTWSIWQLRPMRCPSLTSWKFILTCPNRQ